MKRGRPPKFGRPGRLVALTLPDDVVGWLHEINPDPAWAIVSLFERQHRRTPVHEGEHPDVELVGIGGRRALIVVPQEAVGALHGVAVVPLGAGRAFLALESGKGMADLELAVIDRLQYADPKLSATERRVLGSLREHLREWRHDQTMTCSTRSILVIERARRQTPRPSRHR